jgi:hypothetical protein
MAPAEEWIDGSFHREAQLKEKMMARKRKYAFTENRLIRSIVNLDSLNPQECGEELEKLRNAAGDLTTESVLESARSKRSPLHKAFIWDDTVAAKKYRTQQARTLIKSVEVTVIDQGEPVVIPVSVQVAGASHYKNTVDVLSDEEARAQLVERALGDARKWMGRYNMLRTELAPIFKQIERLSN